MWNNYKLFWRYGPESIYGFVFFTVNIVAVIATIYLVSNYAFFRLTIGAALLVGYVILSARSIKKILIEGDM